MYEIYFGTYDKKEVLVNFLIMLQNEIAAMVADLKKVEDRPNKRQFFYVRIVAVDTPINVYADDESAEFVIGGPPEEDK